MNIEAYKENLSGIAKNISDWIDEGFNLIVSLVIENGGFLRTPQGSDKPNLYAFYDYGLSVAPSQVAIQGLHYSEELGLCICTDDMLDNYQYDNDYQFEYYFDFEGQDLEELNKALSDPSYYVEFDRYELNRERTIINLLEGLPEYL